MARPQTVTDEQIRDAARAVFVEHGPKASVTLVAKRLGVSHAALFQRIGSKETLMRMALAPRNPTVPPLLKEPPPAEDIREALEEVLLQLLENLRDVVPGLVVMRSAGINLEATLGTNYVPPPVALRLALSRWLEEAAVRSRRPLRAPRGVAEALLGAIEARAFNVYLGSESYVRGSDRSFVKELLDGVAPT